MSFQVEFLKADIRRAAKRLFKRSLQVHREDPGLYRQANIEPNRTSGRRKSWSRPPSFT